MIYFDELTHTYTREDGKVLISVTTAIKKYIQPDIYEGVPEAVLERARQRGSEIHATLDNIHKGIAVYESEHEEVGAYMSWCKKHPRNIIATEEMVSDEELIAGTIDQVEQLEDGSIALADVKTTASVNREYLEWQLSLYAYMWEKTHESKVTSLYCMHLKGDKCDRVEINRLSDETIGELLEAIANEADTFDNPLKRLDNDADILIIKYANLAAEMADIDAIAKRKQKDMADILAKLNQMAEEKKASELHASIGVFYPASQTTKRLFNADQFFATHPELKDKMEDGMKVSVVNNKPKIKWNK